MSRPPRIFSAEASRVLSRRLSPLCCWKIPKNHNLHINKMQINPVFWEITSLSGECGPLTWYDGGSYINRGPCALLRQQRSEKFKYEKEDEICFNSEWQPAETVSHTTENSNKRNGKYCLRQHKNLEMLPPFSKKVIKILIEVEKYFQFLQYNCSVQCTWKLFPTKLINW